MLNRINSWEDYSKAKELYENIMFNSNQNIHNSHHLQSLAHAIREKMADFERRMQTEK